MSASKKPAIIVAVLLGGLIILPVLFMLLSRGCGGSGPGSGSAGTGPAAAAASNPVADFELQNLAAEAEALLEGPLAEALRGGAVSLDLMADLRKEFDRAREALADGKPSRAGAGFREVVERGEAALAAKALADEARRLNAETFAQLKRVEPLRASYENTYQEAVETYNRGLAALNAGDFETSVKDFKMAEAILADIDARATRQIASTLEIADAALEALDLEKARQSYQSVLAIEPANSRATDGLAAVTALSGITEAIRSIRQQAAGGDFAGALTALEQLAASNPHNGFIEAERAAIKAQQVERDFQKHLAAAGRAEGEGNYAAAIESIKAALALRPDAQQAARLAELERKYAAARVATLLARAYAELEAGRNEAARALYREALALDPDSEEARRGLEKASSLYLAEIRYTQNLENAEKFIEQGRYPMAGNFFNKAMSSRPSNVGAALAKREASIRDTLEAQSEKVPVTIKSDNRTYVSIIGVLPPDRFKTERLSLYPDVYTVRGSRSGYADVEMELRVDAEGPPPEIEVIASAP